MLTQRYALLPMALLSSLSLFLMGCGGPNLFDRLRNPWGYGFCSFIVLVLDIVALVEVLGSDRSTGNKVIWALVIIFFPVLGLILYYVFGRD